MRKSVGLLAMWLLLVAPAAGREIYVDNLGGDDSFTGHIPQSMPDRSGPVRTIAKALRLAQNGDRIVLAGNDEPYRESISLVGSRHSGYLQQSFTIEGNGAVLDGSAPVPVDAWEHFEGAVFRFRPPRQGPQQLFLDDRPAIRVIPEMMADRPPKLQKLEWCSLGGYTYFCVEPEKLPDDYSLTYAALPTGITLYHVRQVAIVDLTVQGFQLDGINAFNSARDVYLGRVTARGNGRAGIAVGGASTVEIDVCIVGNNGRAQLLTQPLSETSVRASQLFSNTAPGWVDRGGRVYIDGKYVEGGLDEPVEAAQP